MEEIGPIICVIEHQENSKPRAFLENSVFREDTERKKTGVDYRMTFYIESLSNATLMEKSSCFFCKKT